MIGVFQHKAARRRQRSFAAMPDKILLVSTHSRAKAAAYAYRQLNISGEVSTHSREKAAAQMLTDSVGGFLFQHTAARRRLLRGWFGKCSNFYVSTHSREKVAAGQQNIADCRLSRFNTQPPEGGCLLPYSASPFLSEVSTHSHPKAAGRQKTRTEKIKNVSTHSRPKAAGVGSRQNDAPSESFNTQPPEGGWTRASSQDRGLVMFQHTAARRRLDPLSCNHFQQTRGFNTQPPEGGWF